MVAVGWAGRVGDRIRRCEPTGVFRGLGVYRVVRSLGHGIPAASLQRVALAVHFQYVDMVGEPVQQRPVRHSSQRLPLAHFAAAIDIYARRLLVQRL